MSRNKNIAIIVIIICIIILTICLVSQIGRKAKNTGAQYVEELNEQESQIIVAEAEEYVDIDKYVLQEHIHQNQVFIQYQIDGDG